VHDVTGPVAAVAIVAAGTATLAVGDFGTAILLCLTGVAGLVSMVAVSRRRRLAYETGPLLPPSGPPPGRAAPTPQGRRGRAPPHRRTR
jgi:hypothetical protein